MGGGRGADREDRGVHGGVCLSTEWALEALSASCPLPPTGPGVHVGGASSMNFI